MRGHIQMKSLYPKKWLVHVSAGERIAAELRMEIISGSIDSGTTLSENQIANKFGASRSPVREAFKVLSSEGLIALERMGAVVVGFSDHDIKEMYDVRVMMELFVLERLMKTDNENLVKRLNQIVEVMNVSVNYEDYEELTLQDLAFHETIIKSINHNRIWIMWSELKPLMECFILLSMRRRFTEAPGDFERIIENHQFIIDAIENKDWELVVQALNRNFKTKKMLDKAREQKGH